MSFNRLSESRVSACMQQKQRPPTNPSKARVQVAFKKKPTETLRFHDHSSCHRHCQTFLPSHPIAFSTTTAPNNARLTLLLPIATTPNLPPPDPRVPAQDSLATLAPQRQHLWRRTAAAATDLHERRLEQAAKLTSALLETRDQASAYRQPGCPQRETEGNVLEEGQRGKRGQAI